MVDLHVRYGKLECELQVASQETAAALAGRERFRLMGSEQYARAKQAMYQVAEVYLEEGRSHAREMMQQEQQLVSRYGAVLVSEARAYQHAQIQGSEAVQQLQQETALVPWIKNRAEEAFAREHVGCRLFVSRQLSRTLHCRIKSSMFRSWSNNANDTACSVTMLAVPRMPRR